MICGSTTVAPPHFVQVIKVQSAAQMFEEVCRYSREADFVFKAAAVADYTPEETATEKMKKKDGALSVSLKRTKDILAWLGENRRPGQVLCGFSMETENVLENSTEKLKKKGVDLICANDLRQAGAGFGVDTNVITLITAQGANTLPLMSKADAANAIIDCAAALAEKK